MLIINDKANVGSKLSLYGITYNCTHCGHIHFCTLDLMCQILMENNYLYNSPTLHPQDARMW